METRTNRNDRMIVTSGQTPGKKPQYGVGTVVQQAQLLSGISASHTTAQGAGPSLAQQQLLQPFKECSSIWKSTISLTTK